MIKEARTSARLSQRGLAERAGSSQPAVARRERGVEDPTVAMLLRDRLGFPLLFERVLIELIPRKTWFWPDGRTDKEPLVSVAAEVAR